VGIYQITYNSDVGPEDRGPSEVDAVGHEPNGIYRVFFNKAGDEILRLDDRTIRSIEET
jgi:hypothetical protein